VLRVYTMHGTETMKNVLLYSPDSWDLRLCPDSDSDPDPNPNPKRDPDPIPFIFHVSPKFAACLFGFFTPTF